MLAGFGEGRECVARTRCTIVPPVGIRTECQQFAVVLERSRGALASANLRFGAYGVVGRALVELACCYVDLASV
jgi:hypothetical protein